MSNVAIKGLGHYVPERILTNHDLEKLVETSHDWIVQRTGIVQRHIAQKSERASHMAIQAGKQALKNAQMSGDEIELIIVATATPDSGFPSVACLVQKAIHAKNAAAFDLSAACSGFLYALTTAKQFIQNDHFKNALVIASEKFASIIDWKDRSTCVLFGDGAGACVLVPSHGKRGILSDFLHAQGQHAELMSIVQEDLNPLDQKNDLMRKPYVVMDGQGLFKLAVHSMVDAVEAALKKAGIAKSEIDCVVPHQANDRIISGVAKGLGIPKEKFFINIDRYGNMSAAAIAVALYEAVEQGRIKTGDCVVLVAFGAGLVSAANVVRW